MYVVWSNTGRSDDDDDDDDNDDDENNDVCSSVPSTIADISLYYHWKFGHDLWSIFMLSITSFEPTIGRRIKFTPKVSIS